MTEDPLQVDLQDHDLLQEVELTTALMAAANRSESALSLREIDELLGVPGGPSRCARRPEVAAEIA